MAGTATAGHARTVETGNQAQTATSVRSIELAQYHTPARGSGERKAIMDAARGPISNALGTRVIFVVETLRTDGLWTYLQAVPHTPDGAPLNWLQTPMAEDWREGIMSDVVMILLRKNGARWQVVDYFIGPTDVAWYEWIDQFGLPEALFYQP